jgi:hemerythrin
MSNHVAWDKSYATGDDGLDAQHRQLLVQCNALAGSLSGDGSEYGPEFQTRLDALIDGVRQLFAAEQARLEGYPTLDDYNDEIDEFEFLVADIATAENFDATEVQRFLSLWCVGHVAGFGTKYRDWLKATPA